MTTIERLKKAVEILESNHVASVEVNYIGESDDIRSYSVKTIVRGAAHNYTVRVQDWFENGEKQTWAKCNCHAGGRDMICRHVLKVAQVDAERFSRDIHLETFSNYKAYKGYHAKAAEVSA